MTFLGKMSISMPKISDDFVFSHQPYFFSFFPSLYCLKSDIIYDPFLYVKLCFRTKNSFMRLFLLSSYFHTHQITLLLEILGDGCMGRPPTSNLGAVPQSSLSLRPCLYVHSKCNSRSSLLASRIRGIRVVCVIRIHQLFLEQSSIAGWLNVDWKPFPGLRCLHSKCSFRGHGSCSQNIEFLIVCRPSAVRRGPGCQKINLWDIRWRSTTNCMMDNNSGQSLNWIRHWIGSQRNSYRAGVTWSREFTWSAIHTAFVGSIVSYSRLQQA